VSGLESSGSFEPETRALHGSWAAVARLTLQVIGVAVLVSLVVSALREAVHLAAAALVSLGQGADWRAGVTLAAAMAAIGFGRGLLLRRPDWRFTSLDAIALTRERQRAPPASLQDSLAVVVKKSLATLLTLGGGGSGGLEAPVVLIGQAGAAAWGRLTRATTPAIALFEVCGVAAAISTLLGAPLTGALFAVELLYGERVAYRSLAWALTASVVAYWLSTAIHGVHPLFVAPPHGAAYSLPEYGGAALVGIAVALPLAWAFRGTTRWLSGVMARVQPTWHAVVTMALLGGLTVALQATLGLEAFHVLGSGEETLRLVLRDDVSLAAWWLPLVLVAARSAAVGLTLSGGGSAGTLFPSMTLGGLSGAFVAKLVTASGLAVLDPSLFAVVGIAAALTGVVGVPIAAMTLVLEVFGKAYGPPAILACGITYIVSLRLRLWQQEDSTWDAGARALKWISRLARRDPERPA
jgi:CIC family chloride channel protein